MPNDDDLPTPPPPTTWPDRHARHIVRCARELSLWGYDWAEGIPDAQDIAILLRRTAAEARSSQVSRSMTEAGALLGVAAAAAEAAARWDRPVCAASVPLSAWHLRRAAANLVAARGVLAAGAASSGPTFLPPQRVAPCDGPVPGPRPSR
ncbi:hypothetical protein ACFV4G_22585 [Kitasatospora sp. NPDC059747]|uniref:hypothetical protein n=1 Tax=Kitasatospora sp. NPDC059747 TaxID=3346930 RepID=UPI00365CA84D